MKMEEGKVCELCDQRASLYCASDSAFLCWKCDAAVHRANFLVARHRRNLLCSTCNRFAGIHVSGAAPRCRVGGGANFPTCRSCLPVENQNRSLDDADSLRSSSSSACVSSSEPRAAEKEIKSAHAPGKRIRTRSCCSSSVTDDDGDGASSPAKQKRRRKNGGGDGWSSEEVMMVVKWSEQLGLGLNDGDRVASLSSRALSFCLTKWNGVPFRVAAATSFWLGLRFCGIGSLATFQNLWKLEAVSGVPAKLILAAHAKLARVFFQHQQLDLEEGCDES